MMLDDYETLFDDHYEDATAPKSRRHRADPTQTRCPCGAMSIQDCDDLPSLRHCGAYNGR
jgi:hypothetical protein